MPARGSTRLKATTKAHDERRVAARETLMTLLQDETFVDYFNVFLNLPVFGQRVLFKRHAHTFIFDPPVAVSKQ
jgi:hypothetical protein